MVAARLAYAVLGQSNATSPGIAANVTVYPGFATPYPAVLMMERSSKLTPLAVVSDPASGSRSLAPRTVSLGSPYDVGTAGIEITYGQTLDKSMPGKVCICKVTLDGSGLENCWLPGGAYPSGGPPWFTQVVGYIQTMLTTMDATLAGIAWLQGTSDALEVPDQDNYLANLITFFTAIRAVPGWSNVAITIDRISSQFVANFSGAAVGGPKIRAAQQAFVNVTPRTALINTDDLALRPDFAHYADNSYATLGIRHAGAMISLTGSWSGYVGLGIGLT